MKYFKVRKTGLRFKTGDDWEGLWIEDDREPTGYKQVMGHCDIQGEWRVRAAAREFFDPNTLYTM